MGKMIDGNSIVFSQNKLVINIILINKLLLIFTILRMVVPNYQPLRSVY
jgi:hypothetical protein